MLMRSLPGSHRSLPRLLASRRRGGVLVASLLALIGLGACAQKPEIAYRPAFCYRTLAEVQCYTEPEPGAATRLVGVHLWRDGDPATAAYWVERARRARAEGEGPVAAERFEIEAWRGAEIRDGCEDSLACSTLNVVTRAVSVGLAPAQSLAGALF
jgi:hypothetical protein